MSHAARRVVLAAALAGACSLLAVTPASASPSGTPKEDVKRSSGGGPNVDKVDARKQHDQGGGLIGAASTGRLTRTSSISYHGGPVMLGATKTFIIWYGNWGTNTAQQIIPDFLRTVGGSPWYGINTTYYSGKLNYITNATSLAGQTSDAYSQGTALTDAGVKTVVASAISSGRLPADASAIYLVLSSSDVSETSGFLTSYCGWHSHNTIAGLDIKYGFIGDASKKLSSCAAQTVSSPNGNPAADAMVSVIAHEVAEAITDPDLNAWYDGSGNENGDRCAWTFGATTKLANGSVANLHLGTRDFLVQQNWKNSGTGSCTMA